MRYLSCYLAILTSLLLSCSGSKNVASDTLSVASSDSTRTALGQVAPPDLTPTQVAQLPRAVQRQYRKNLRAQPRKVPLVQGRAAVAAAGDIAAPTQTSYKPNKSTTVQATDSANVQTAQSKEGPAVAGEGNQVPVTTTEESWVRAVLPYAAGLAGLGLIYSLLPMPVNGAGWLLFLLKRKRKREPTLSPPPEHQG